MVSEMFRVEGMPDLLALLQTIADNTGFGITGITASADEINTLDGLTATQAELNALHGRAIGFAVIKEMTDADWTAGVTLIPAVEGKSIVPLVIQVASKTALTCTATSDVTLKDTAGSPATVLTLAVANLSGSNAVLMLGSTGFTAAAPALTGLAVGKGLVTTPVADVTSTTSSTWLKIIYALV